MGKRDQAAGEGAHQELMKAEPYWAGIEDALRAREVRARAYAQGRPAAPGGSGGGTCLPAALPLVGIGGGGDPARLK